MRNVPERSCCRSQAAQAYPHHREQWNYLPDTNVPIKLLLPKQCKRNLCSTGRADSMPSPCQFSPRPSSATLRRAQCPQQQPSQQKQQTQSLQATIGCCELQNQAGAQPRLTPFRRTIVSLSFYIPTSVDFRPSNFNLNSRFCSAHWLRI